MRIQATLVRSALLVTIAAVAAGCGRSGKTDPSASSAASTPAVTIPQGKITASPNPIPVCDGSDLGETSLSWSDPAQGLLEVRVGSPDGPLFAQTRSVGSKETGKWVTGNTVFYLQRVVDGGRASVTIATVRVKLTKDDCR